MHQIRNARRLPWLLVGILMFLIVGGLAGQSQAKEIELVLHVDPELDLDGSEKIYIGPIMVEPRAEEATKGLDRIASREFEHYLRRLLRRETKLEVLDPIEDLAIPTKDPLELFEKTSFWTDISRESGAEYVVTAAVDV